MCIKLVIETNLCFRKSMFIHYGFFYCCVGSPSVGLVVHFLVAGGPHDITLKWREFWTALIQFWTALMQFWTTMMQFWTAMMQFWTALMQFWTAMMQFWTAMMQFWTALMQFWTAMIQFWTAPMQFVCNCNSNIFAYLIQGSGRTHRDRDASLGQPYSKYQNCPIVLRIYKGRHKNCLIWIEKSPLNPPK